MNSTARNILTIAGVIIIGFLIWYFNNIVIYILVSLVLALMGKPLFDQLARIRYKKLHLPASIRAFITLLVLIVLVLSFFGLFIPLVVSKVHEISGIDPEILVRELQNPLDRIEQFINHYKIKPESYFSVEKLIENVVARINIGQLANAFSSVAGWLGNIFVAFFAIAFITFFFLKDDKMFSRTLLMMIPDKHTLAVENALKASRHMLSRYFTGILIETISVLVLSSIGLLIIGFPIKDAVLVGFVAGIFNIIPYLGPAMGTLFGVFVGIVNWLTRSNDQNIWLLLFLTLIVFIIVQLFDNIVIQPFVYSSSVNAHPLEIFLVFLAAGSLGGLVGMILAIPTYTVLRVFAKEFFNNFKLVRSLTRNI
jgi:predicted PurR-regulated permease PerM